MQTIIPWSNLFRSVRQKTADFQKLTEEICERHPFAQLQTLSSCIEDRFQYEVLESGEASARPWIVALGSGLARVDLGDETENQRIRALGRSLSQTRFQIVTALKTTPYIDEIPSGTARQIEVLWKDRNFYVENKSMAKMAITIAQELGRHFGRGDITDAIKLCFEREPAFVTEYLEENYKLLPLEQIGREASEIPTQKIHAALSPDIEKSKETEPSPSGETANTDISLPSSSTSGSSPSDNSPLDGQPDSKPDGENYSGDGMETYAPRRQSQRSSKPKLIERFAALHGAFNESSEGRLYLKDGGWLERATGASFPWERYSAFGELLQCYWVKDHCIEREPLQLEADVWDLCINRPEKYTLLLISLDGAPVEYSGKRICNLRDNGRLTLSPASYRIRYEHDERPAYGNESAKGRGANNGYATVR
jgi:hypothetical protein